MTKDQCEAIIRAIEESTKFVMTNGLSSRERLSDPTSDAAYVESLLTAYSSAIDAIINNIQE